MQTRRLNILIIDDDPGCRKTAQRFFTLVGGHKVETAETGEEGIRKISETLPDIILLDMMLPDMDGMQVMARLSADPRTRFIPIILLTGMDIEASVREELERQPGFCFVEQKPARFSDLLLKMERLMAGKNTSLEYPGGISRDTASETA